MYIKMWLWSYYHTGLPAFIFQLFGWMKIIDAIADMWDMTTSKYIMKMKFELLSVFRKMWLKYDSFTVYRIMCFSLG